MSRRRIFGVITYVFVNIINNPNINMLKTIFLILFFMGLCFILLFSKKNDKIFINIFNVKGILTSERKICLACMMF